MRAPTVSPDAVASFAQAFSWSLRDLTAADNHVSEAERRYRDETGDWSKNGGLQALFSRPKPTNEELLSQKLNRRTSREAREEDRLKPFAEALAAAENEREQVRTTLATLAEKLLHAAIDLGVQDTTALTVFRRTWANRDLLCAAGLVDNIAARAWLSMRQDDLAAAVSRALACLAELNAVEVKWWQLATSRSDSGLNPTFGPDGLPTPEHSRRADAFLQRLWREQRELMQRRDELRDEIRRLSQPLMAIAVRPEINGQPSRLRNLLDNWNVHTPSNPELLHAARNFLVDLALKLGDPSIAQAISRHQSLPRKSLVEAEPGFSPRQNAIIQILTRLNPGEGLEGKEIAARLPKEHHKSEATLRRHDFPRLTAAGVIANTPGVGYHLAAPPH